MKKYNLLVDLCLKNPNLFNMLIEENKRQIKKWGIQIHDPFEWLAYTTEELGELSRAISEYVYRGGLVSGVIMEAIHVATLSLKIAEMFLNEENN